MIYIIIFKSSQVCLNKDVTASNDEYTSAIGLFIFLSE